MKNQEWSLSDKIQENCFGNDRVDIIIKEDVKEFIRRLKEEVKTSTGTMEREDVLFIIDALAGRKLT